MKFLLGLTALIFGLTSCSMLSSSGRRQYSYEKYVRRHAITRQHSESHWPFHRHPKIPKPTPSEPSDSSLAANGPQAFRAEPAPQSRPNEPVEAPPSLDR